MATENHGCAFDLSLEDIFKFQCNSVKFRGKHMFHIPALKDGITRSMVFFARFAALRETAGSYYSKRTNNCYIPTESPSPYPLPAGERIKVRGQKRIKIKCVCINNV